MVYCALAGVDASRTPEMDAKLQRRVQRYGWDRAASHYERSWQSQLEPAQSALLELAGLEPGIDVLDVACGTGLVALKAAVVIMPGGRIVGTDISEQMVLAAQDIAASRGIANAHFERMEAEQSTFGENSFDVVLCALGLMYVPDPEKAIRDFHRVLRPGGRAVCAVWGQRGKCGWAEFSPSLMRVSNRRFAQCSFALAQPRTCSMRSALPGLATLSKGDLRHDSNTPRATKPVMRHSSADRWRSPTVTFRPTRSQKRA